MHKITKLNLNDWQTFYLKKDLINGNLIASILQTIYKNKYTSLVNLSKIIDKNTSVVLSGEGTADFLNKFKDLINFIPKFYITNYTGTNISDSLNEDFKAEFMLTIKCDFIITLNFDYFIDISNEYISSINKDFNHVLSNNDSVLCKFLIKNLLYGNFFISEEFLRNEIFESKLQYTGLTAKELFYKFGIKKNSTFEDLFDSANQEYVNKEDKKNIKTISISFTPFHINNYLKMYHQKIYKERFDIGRGELRVNLLYLDAEYIIKNENNNIYNKLVNDFYLKYFSDEKSRKLNRSIFTHIEEKLDSITSLFNEKPSLMISGVDKNILSDEYYDNYFEPVSSLDIFNKDNIKELIFKSLKNEKVPKKDLDFLKNLDKDKLQIKKTFVEAIDKLTSPFLSKIIETSELKFLKQYIITNYGESLKENVSDELRLFVEKKFKDFVRSKSCNFIEYLGELIKIIAELTDEREYIIEVIIKNSFLYKNFIFIKYFNVPKRLTTKTFDNILKLLEREFNYIQDSGVEDNLIIIPFMKIKEFLIYLTGGVINNAWEKLSLLFNNILPMINANMYSASFNEIEVNMTYFKDGVYDLFIKDKKDAKTFSIKSLEDIEYIFQDKELEKLRFIIEELYKLHQKESFGFNNKGDFNKFLEAYDKRYNEYFIYKKRDEEFEEFCSGENIIIAIIKKILCLIPRSLNQHNLIKITQKNNELLKKVDYYYFRDDQPLIDTAPRRAGAEIRNKISDFIEFRKEKKGATKDKDAREDNDVFIKAKIYGETTGKSNFPPLIQLEDNEKKLFDKIKDFLIKQKEVIFTLDTNSQDDNIVLYIKENLYTKQNIELVSSKLLKEIDKKDINTIEEIGTRYSLIKRLVEKRYLVLKNIYIIKKDKQVYRLFLSKSYYHFNTNEN